MPSPSGPPVASTVYLNQLTAHPCLYTRHVRLFTLTTCYCLPLTRASDHVSLFTVAHMSCLPGGHLILVPPLVSMPIPCPDHRRLCPCPSPHPSSLRPVDQPRVPPAVTWFLSLFFLPHLVFLLFPPLLTFGLHYIKSIPFLTLLFFLTVQK